MSVSAVDSQRARLLSLLWNLKRAVDTAPNGSLPGVNYVHFTALRKDEAYRADLLEKALQSGDDRIRALAQEIHSVQLEAGPGADAARSSDLGTGPAAGGRFAPGQIGNADPLPHVEPRRTRRQAGAVVGVVLAGIGLAAAGYLATDTGLLEQLTRVDVEGSLTQDALWRSGRTYRLKGLVFVEGTATLTIEGGTRIVGEPGSALIVTRDARIHARGSVEQPIVFTSAKPAGERARGDWGGLVLLGNAPVNTPLAHVEGIAPQDLRGAYGGANDVDSCGVLQYVRIEFAGHEISKDNELNGLTLGGCGSGTILRFVQVHMGLDDGVEFFGGSANLSHVVISRAADDGLDWDRGWTGSGQFIVIQQDAHAGDNGIEADNLKADHHASPRSAPTLSNLTIVGGANPELAQRGMTLRRGTAADLRNILIAGFSVGAIDIRDPATAEQIATGALRADALVFTEAVNGRVFERETGEEDDDGAFDEEAFFLQGDRIQSVYMPERLFSYGVHSLTEPDFTPGYNESLLAVNAPIPQGEFWDEAANFVGAIRPGSRTTWLEGWTAFPKD